ncbi:MAG: cytochrome P450, partial [Myxococcales bacterium]|nr:cytochrome P450 [Myxococcales bacterium]
MAHENQNFVFDPTTEAFAYDPYPTYAWLRANAPVYYWAERDTYVLSRQEESRAFFTHDLLTTDIHQWEHHPGPGMYEQPGFEAFGRIQRSSPFSLAPQDHARVRKLSSVALTPRAVRRMHDAIADIVDRTLDEIVARDGEVINVRDFAEIIPLEVICDLVGIPAGLRAEFRVFGQAAIRAAQPTTDGETLASMAGAFEQGVALLERIIEDRRADQNPPDDLLTDFIQASDEGQRMSNDELISIVFALIVAGSDTTVHGTCYAVESLLRHPEALAEIRADRSLLRGAIEECLRWNSFGKLGTYRYATQDMEFAGAKLRKGQAVVMLMGSVLRDERAYDHPERFDIHRDYQGSLTFG